MPTIGICQSTQRDSGSIPSEFLLTARVISLRFCLHGEKWPCALLDWFAPSDAAPFCAPTHKPSRIVFVTSHGYFRQENIREKITHAHTLSPEQERKVDQRIFFSLLVSLLMQKLSVARHMVLFVQKAQ